VPLGQNRAANRREEMGKNQPSANGGRCSRSASKDEGERPDSGTRKQAETAPRTGGGTIKQNDIEFSGSVGHFHLCHH